MISTLNSIDITNKDSNLESWINEVEKNKPNYVITGHSLGGATALLLAAYLSTKENVESDRLTLITFAQPAVGKWDFASKYRPRIRNYIKVINIGNPDKKISGTMPSILGDPVVSAASPFNYQHFGDSYLIAIDTNDDIRDMVPASAPEVLSYTVGLHSVFNYSDFVLACDILDPNTVCKPILKKPISSLL